MFPEILEKVPSPTGLLLGILLVLFASWLWSKSRSPGPWGVPVLGYYPFLRKDYYVQLHELAQKYGEVYVINIAGQDFLYLDSMRALREAHVNKADCFSSRSRNYGIFQAILINGLLYNDGEEWRVQRKFFVQAMREVGIVPKKAEQKGPIEDAIRDALDTFRDKRNEAMDVLPLMIKQCTAVVLRLVLGDDITEEEETKMSELYSKVLEPMFGMNLVLMGNIAKWFLFPRIPGFKEMVKCSNEMKVLLNKIFLRHKESFNAEDPPRDMIDLFLKEKTRREKKGDPTARYLTDLAFVSSLEQIYGDGSVSIGMLIGAFYRAITAYPDIQDSVHEEIVRVVGSERLPSWEDRPNLPLTYSVILEFLRTNVFVTLFADLECSKDTTVLGVTVPRGCVTLMNMWSVNNNPKTYENPDQFVATRFLPEKKSEQPLLFGVGKRACIGENLVMTEMFCFISATMQNFRVLPEKDSDAGAQDVSKASFTDSVYVRFIPRPGSRYAS